VSAVAVTAMVLGLLTVPVFSLVPLIVNKRPPVHAFLQAQVVFIGFFIPLMAILLGVFSLFRIAQNRATLTGSRYAVIAILFPILVFFLGTLLTSLKGVRGLATRMTCGTNLSGMGKAMLIYANDYEDVLPKAGGPVNSWGDRLINEGWQAHTPTQAYGQTEFEGAGVVTTTSYFYLLIRHAELHPKQFVCKGEADTWEFKLADYPPDDETKQLADLFDFGPWISATDSPSNRCSYSYHMPFGRFGLTISHEPTMAVAGDRNPWLFMPSDEIDAAWSAFIPDTEPFNGTSASARQGNAKTHHGDGQNILFLDSHVSFEKRPTCGPEEDNVYTIALSSGDQRERRKGILVTPYAYDEDVENASPLDHNDSVLVQDDGRPTWFKAK